MAAKESSLPRSPSRRWKSATPPAFCHCHRGRRSAAERCEVYIIQFHIVSQLREKGPCVIVGRCADYVLRDRPDVLKVFLHATMDFRKKFALADEISPPAPRTGSWNSHPERRISAAFLLQLLHPEPLAARYSDMCRIRRWASTPAPADREGCSAARADTFSRWEHRKRGRMIHNASHYAIIAAEGGPAYGCAPGRPFFTAVLAARITKTKNGEILLWYASPCKRQDHRPGDWTLRPHPSPGELPQAGERELLVHNGLTFRASSTVS